MGIQKNCVMGYSLTCPIGPSTDSPKKVISPSIVMLPSIVAKSTMPYHPNNAAICFTHLSPCTCLTWSQMVNRLDNLKFWDEAIVCSMRTYITMGQMGRNTLPRTSYLIFSHSFYLTSYFWDSLWMSENLPASSPVSTKLPSYFTHHLVWAVVLIYVMFSRSTGPCVSYQQFNPKATI